MMSTPEASVSFLAGPLCLADRENLLHWIESAAALAGRRLTAPVIAGWRYGYFTAEDEPAIAAPIAAFGAAILIHARLPTGAWTGHQIASAKARTR